MDVRKGAYCAFWRAGSGSRRPLHIAQPLDVQDIRAYRLYLFLMGNRLVDQERPFKEELCKRVKMGGVVQK